MVDVPALENILGHTFIDPSNAVEALTHASVNEDARHQAPSNERLAFLGDAVIGLVVAEWLSHGPGGQGDLSIECDHIVNNQSLARRAELIGLMPLLKRGKSRPLAQDGVEMRAQALEAIAGAVFRDAGYETARAVVGRFLLLGHP